ncbi:MAG: NUDIX domain-containing protein [Patescibacteria group bacterium]|nr:NUDIX domain-containing protein [Patescibacteria group bacterium]MDE2438462.1 NUDIX domain-containing protein [Patescibacteria group bacterium]
MRKTTKEPAFIPQPGQVDFSHARWAPVINCVVTHKGRILLVQRSKELRLYPGYWNGISGFLDDQRSLIQKVKDEICEETGIARAKIKNIKFGRIFDAEAPKYKKTWIVHPVLVEVASDAITLDWEAEKYRWVTLQEAKTLKLLPSFKDVLEAVKPLLHGK